MSLQKGLLPLLVWVFVVTSPTGSFAAENLSLGGLLQEGASWLEKILSVTTVASPVKKQIYPISAHMQGAQSGRNIITVYYRTVNDKAVNNGFMAATPQCPVGWTEAVRGYGPHYVGLYAYDWSGGGWGGSWWWPSAWPPGPGGSYPPSKEPEDPPPPPEPPPPNPGGDNPGGTYLPDDPRFPKPGDPPPNPGPPPPPPPGGGGGPTTPGGGYYPGEEVPPPFPGPTGPTGEPLEPGEGWPPPWTPPWGPGPYAPPGDGPSTPSTGMVPSPKQSSLSLFGGLIKKVVAQQPYSYLVSDIDFASASVCSADSEMVVNLDQMFQGQPYNASASLFADACYGGHCNRCVICVK